MKCCIFNLNIKNRKLWVLKCKKKQCAKASFNTVDAHWARTSDDLENIRYVTYKHLTSTLNLSVKSTLVFWNAVSRRWRLLHEKKLAAENNKCNWPVTNVTMIIYRLNAKHPLRWWPRVCEVKLGGTYEREYNLYFVSGPKANTGPRRNHATHTPLSRTWTFHYPNPTYT